MLVHRPWVFHFRRGYAVNAPARRNIGQIKGVGILVVIWRGVDAVAVSQNPFEVIISPKLAAVGLETKEPLGFIVAGGESSVGVYIPFVLIFVKIKFGSPYVALNNVPAACIDRKLLVGGDGGEITASIKGQAGGLGENRYVISVTYLTKGREQDISVAGFFKISPLKFCEESSSTNPFE